MNRQYIIEAESGVSFGRILVMGRGKTSKEAWEDAIGPKPWSTYQKNLSKKYWIRQTCVAGTYEPVND